MPEFQIFSRKNNSHLANYPKKLLVYFFQRRIGGRPLARFDNRTAFFPCHLEIRFRGLVWKSRMDQGVNLHDLQQGEIASAHVHPCTWRRLSWVFLETWGFHRAQKNQRADRRPKACQAGHAPDIALASMLYHQPRDVPPGLWLCRPCGLSYEFRQTKWRGRAAGTKR